MSSFKSRGNLCHVRPQNNFWNLLRIITAPEEFVLSKVMFCEGLSHWMVIANEYEGAVVEISGSKGVMDIDKA